MEKIKTLSLFANVGIAESYLDSLGITVVLANELDEQRIKFYNHLYPNIKTIPGDITEKEVQKEIINCSKLAKIDMIMATPPCQGMSSVGKKDKNDIRNQLIKEVVHMVKEIMPKYVFLENVPEQLSTFIKYKEKKILIPEYLELELGNEYIFNENKIINAANYGVPQTRERAIILMVRKDLNKKWEFPIKDQKVVTLSDAISHFPSLDPEVYDISYEEQIEFFPEYEKKRKEGLKFSKWHYPPKHVYRQVYSLMHTPSGKTAFNNKDEYKPKKTDGSFVKGFKNTYKRQSWNKPGYTITMYNRTIGSQNNVHPGRLLGKDENGEEIYSDARVLTICELLTVSSLPLDWNIPDWASDHFVRQVIGEGIPPLLVKKIMQELVFIHE
ncbi:MAG: DNA cytosine methyltransferase [Bacilli bacterium]|nr:DNA cytosine methyltransferase [Bacilli bacterium]